MSKNLEKYWSVEIKCWYNRFLLLKVNITLSAQPIPFSLHNKAPISFSEPFMEYTIKAVRKVNNTYQSI